MPTGKAESDERAAGTERVLVLTPTGRDGALTRDILDRNGIAVTLCDSMRQLVEGIDAGANAALVTEEALDEDSLSLLVETLDEQPPWSEFPVLVLTSRYSEDPDEGVISEFSDRAQVTLVDRPIRIETLLSSVRAAITAREHQYELRDLLAELQDRVRERDQFLAMLGHELRNPLYAIVLAMEDVESDDEELAERLSIIQRQSAHLQRLVDDLLDISRVTRGKVELERSVLDLREILSSCVDEMRPRAQKEQRQLVIDLPDERIPVSVDRVRIEQVVNNLVVNSLKYTQTGGRISMKAHAEGENAIIEVEDDGDGIAPEILPTIFDLFAQAGTRTDEHQGGLGLGLTLVQRLVELHGGTVDAYSDGIGKGSRIIVRLPMTDAAEPEPIKPLPSDRKDPTRPRQILLIEDNEEVRTLLSVNLGKIGYEVLEAGTGPDGVERSIESKPDVALVDIGLPGFDGHEVARRIREQLGDRIVLIAVTGYGQAEDRKSALEAGFDHHVAKPVKPSELDTLINNALLSAEGEAKEQGQG